MANVKASKVALWTATIVLVLLGFEFLWLIRDVLFLVFLSILLATGIEPVVKWLRRGPFNRGTGILVVYTFIIGVLILMGFLIVPPIISEGQSLVKGFTDPQTARTAIGKISNDFIKGVATTVYDNASTFFQNFKPGTDVVNLGLSFFGAIFSVVTVFVIAFYWLTERSSIKRFIFSFASEEKRPRVRLIWDSVEEKLGAWVRGQLLLMLFIGVLDAVGYTIIGVKFALALATFAGLAELIPLVGPYIGGAPAILIALTQGGGFTLAIIVAVYIVIIQLIEGNVLVPRIMEKAVGVSPLSVILGILIGSTLMGIGGALLAVPITAAIQVSLNHILSFGSDEVPRQEAAAASTDTSRALNAAATVRDMDKEKKANSNDRFGGTPTGPQPSI